MHDEIQKLANENLESLLYTLDYAHFDNFHDMEKYLENADITLNNKIEKMDEKIESVNEEYIRASTVFQLNNKKRQKEEELLKIERGRIQRDLQEHSQTLKIQIHPMTMTLKQKKIDLEKLEQTKQIIEDFEKMIQGSEEEIKRLMPLDSTNFKNSAFKIYIFQNILQDNQNPQYDNLKHEIQKKYIELKNKILSNFKEGYWKKDKEIIKNVLPYCYEYELIDNVSDFYNQQAFKEVLTVTKLNNEEEGQVQIRNMFFLIERGFNSAFIAKDNIGEINPYEIYSLMGEYSDTISRRLVTYVFEKIIRESIDNILRSIFNPINYLKFLQLFYDECKKLLKLTETVMKDEKSIHLMSTYFESIFDTYLDSYLSKQLNALDQVYEDCATDIMKEIESTSESVHQKQQHRIESKKNTFRKIVEFHIESNKKIEEDPENVRVKVESLIKMFMNPSLELIFEKTKKGLARNNKIARINQIDRNRNEILQLFLKNLEEIIENLLKLIKQIVPSFDEKALALDQEFFQIIPNINFLLQRMQFIYEEYKKQAKYSFSEGIKLDQRKEDVLISCTRSLNKIVGEAIATILTSCNNILHNDPAQYCPTSTQASESRSKLNPYLDRYLRSIGKIQQPTYRQHILKLLGLQLCSMLINFYSSIRYNKEGLAKLLMDVAKYKNLIAMFSCQEVEQKFRVLRSLIDVYVIKCDEKTMLEYVDNEKETVLSSEPEEIIQKYIHNKIKNQQ